MDRYNFTGFFGIKKENSETDSATYFGDLILDKFRRGYGDLVGKSFSNAGLSIRNHTNGKSCVLERAEYQLLYLIINAANKNTKLHPEVVKEWMDGASSQSISNIKKQINEKLEEIGSEYRIPMDTRSLSEYLIKLNK